MIASRKDRDKADLAAAKDKQDLRQRVVRFLAARGVRGLNSLDVHVDGGTVILRGRTVSSQDRWLCVNCSQHVVGVLRVVDELNTEGEVDGAVRRHPK